MNGTVLGDLEDLKIDKETCRPDFKDKEEDWNNVVVALIDEVTFLLLHV